VFLNSTAHRLTPSWLDDLIGYLALDKRIGAVGGKVLDEFLRVRGGGLLVDRDGQYHTICGGEFDNSTGHWHIGQIASNVDAVSASLLATRLELLLSQEDLDFEELGEAWSLAYCAGLREKDFRIVYNPFSKIYDPGDMRISAAARERIAEIGRSAKTRRYYLEF
jgi:hypothetical protein